MADWRTRGYVSDSDEDDESQISLGRDFQQTKPTLASDDDTLIDPLDEREQEFVNLNNRHLKGGGNSSNVKPVSSNKNVKEPSRISPSLGKIETQGDYQEASGSQEQDTDSNEGLKPLDYEKIDELQKDHFRKETIDHFSQEVSPKAHGETEPTLSSPLDLATDSSPSHHVSPPHLDPSNGRLELFSLADGFHSYPKTLGSGDASERSDQDLSISSDQCPDHGARTQATKTVRTFRQRNPIQLHPYAIEIERYRQTCKARGVKPLRIGQQEAEATSVRGDESQDAEYPGEETQELDRNSHPDSLRSPSHTGIDHGAGDCSSDDNGNIAMGDDDFPDLDALLRNPPRKYIGNGYKRRKVASASFRMPSSMKHEMQQLAREKGSGVAMDNSCDNDDDTIFDMPLSPPHSNTQTPGGSPHAESEEQQPKQKLTKIAIPTPVTSSEPRRPQLLEISDDDPSEDNLTSDEKSNFDEIPSMGKTASELQQAKRKIRGVLPASWLKIDLKAQKKQSASNLKTARSASPQPVPTQRGVARAVATRRSKSPLMVPRRNIFSVSDSDDSVSASNDAYHALSARHIDNLSRGKDGNIIVDQWGEALEDDRVDPMLPSNRNYKHHSRKGKKRQTKIAGFDSNPRTSPHRPLYQSQGRRKKHFQAEGRAEVLQPAKPKFKPPKVGILDSPFMTSSSQDYMPQFLKVASRAVRARKDRGRHSPSRKYLRLATKNDDDDINGTLRGWREGTIVPKPAFISKSEINRKPLHPRSTNIVSFPHESGATNPDLTARLSSAGSMKHRPSIKHTRKLQSSLDHIIQRTSNLKGQAERSSNDCEAAKRIAKRKEIASSVRELDASRPAMLESGTGFAAESNAQLTLQRDLSKVSNFDNGSPLANLLHLRRNNTNQAPNVVLSHKSGDNTLLPSRKSERTSMKTVSHRKRKRRPQRFNLSSLPSNEYGNLGTIDKFSEAPLSIGTPSLRLDEVVTGLGSYGVTYTSDFGIGALPSGTCFHQSTFLGCGLFCKSLNFENGSALDRPRGHALLEILGKTHRWGPWNDLVSSEIWEITNWLSQTHDTHTTRSRVQADEASVDSAISALRALIGYFSDHLSFLDAVDRLSCVQQCKKLLTTLILEIDSENAFSTTHLGSASAVRFQIMGLVFANQVHRICQGEHVPLQLRNEIWSLVEMLGQNILTLVFTYGISDFQRCISMCQDPGTNGQLIRDEYPSVEALVIAWHILTLNAEHSSTFWKLVQFKTPNKSLSGSLDIRMAEESWKQLFQILPFLEFDSNGILEAGGRLRKAHDNWLVIKQLVGPVLEASLANPQGQSPGFNEYCRSLFRRCLHLINGWGWRRCESIIGTLFDFFARNHLAHLNNEESHGSPIFLQHLGEQPSINAEPEDRCFHILLKIIASGMRHMQHFYPEKRIRSLIWRLMPNHGRSHPKDQPVHQADLDALRNHHDLLSTLYWASPPDSRPRLTAIRNLVHLESSHREACHINIRAWSYLVKFQLAANESSDCLHGFRVWYDDLLDQILALHSLARTEAEDQLTSIHDAGNMTVSRELFETTVIQNQRQIEAILSDALVCLKLAVDAASDEQGAAALVSMTLTRVFDMLDVRKPQCTRTISQALEVFASLFSKTNNKCSTMSRDNNDDSQDYGDWPNFEDYDDTSAPARKEVDEVSSLQKFQEPFWRLLSNSFGSDLSPDEPFLLKLVDVWVGLAQSLVRRGEKSWDDYIDRFGGDLWTSLRDTEQTRKYTARYLSTLIERDQGILAGHKQYFIKSWIGCLVERESLLKFQHQLTQALLNANCDSPILHNLPFWINAATGCFEISVSDFSERRLALISSVLSNMRVSIEPDMVHSLTDAAHQRQECKVALKHMMGTMKHNYQELGQGSQVRGAYVDFVHSVVELLQQHTSTICPIDRFFTDSAAFPLPTADPTYVIGQLKSYALRLQEAKTPKQLAIFLQSISERAAIEGHQTYFISQLHAAMTKTFEDGISATPTLRAFLVKAIIPAYLEMACATSISVCGWVLALPYLQSLRMVFAELLVDLDGVSKSSLKAVSSILDAFLQSVRQSFRYFLSPTDLVEEAGVLKLISACYSAATTALPVVDYVYRLSGLAQCLTEHIDFLKIFGKSITARLQGHDHDYILESTSNLELEYGATRNFAAQELKESLSKNWTYIASEQQIYFSKGGCRKEVLIDIGLYEEERADLLQVLGEFFVSVQSMPSLYDEDDTDHSMALARMRIADSEQLMI
ncbi:hypothetical protein ACLMJK_005266 [Lecanora helva]